MSSDEEKHIEVMLGPDRGARWKVPAAVAKKAISDGWARDPMEPPAEDVPELTPEKREKAITAAVKAARELRGEDEEAGDTSGEYETSDMQPRRGPGRPRKESAE